MCHRELSGLFDIIRDPGNSVQTCGGAVDGTACLRRSGNLPAVEFSSAGKENMPADTLVVKIRVPPDRRTMFCEKNIKDRLKSKNIVMLEDKKITKNKIFI